MRCFGHVPLGRDPWAPSWTDYVSQLVQEHLGVPHNSTEQGVGMSVAQTCLDGGNVIN